MNIPAVSIALSQSKLQTNVGVAMLSKSLDVLEQTGETMAAMLDAPAPASMIPGLGENIDISI
ncbi:putative motility protein [bacterium 1XD42-8]|jgi:hypothetical protein|nr:putative motility protein [Lachnospiraceae bacterium]RKJ52976.1 putative motility protein [bacterium 1XD42-8]